MKYIVEADEHVQMISLIAVREGTAIMITGNAETFQTADKALEEAYQKGYDAGSHEATTLEYQQGLDDAWGAAKKIFSLDDFEAEKCGLDDVDGMTASEAISKLKAYEERQKSDEIKVGDEMEAYDDPSVKIIVTQVKGDMIWGFNSEGTFSNRPNFDWRKTGRNFPQVAGLFEAMKEGAE